MNRQKITKKILSLLCVLLLCTVPVKAADQPRLVDDAHLLSEEEASELQEKLDEISERQQMDVAVVTVNSLDGKDPQTYTDDYYEENGYGFGEDRDGIILLLSMEERDWEFSTSGYGILTFTDAGLDYIASAITPSLKDGNYAEAFTTYADQCDKFITQAYEGTPYDTGNMPKKSLGFLYVILALIIGFALAFVPMMIMKGQLKTVQTQNRAQNYVKEKSVKITEQRDQYLYNRVSRTRIQRDNNSGGGGGSITHQSSSGTSHGGLGGKF